MKGWNRIDDAACVGCGMPLISPKDAVLLMCTECQKKAQEGAKKILNNKKNAKGFVKRAKLKIPEFMVADRVKRKKK